MLKYSIKRLLQSLLTLFIIVTVVFLLMRLLPEEGYFGDAYEKARRSTKRSHTYQHGIEGPIAHTIDKLLQELIEG